MPRATSPSEKKPYVEIVTDGACSPNPGLGGWGVVLISPAHDNHRRELSGSEANTTNNRMELRATIEGLRALKRPCRVTLTTDSKYVSKAFTARWLDRWQRNGWQTMSKKPVQNADLWRELVDLTAIHDVEWVWVKGHANHRDNERADQLAVRAREALRALRKRRHRSELS